MAAFCDASVQCRTGNTTRCRHAQYFILVVQLLLQLLAVRAADLLLRDLPRRIERDEIGSALVLAAVKLAAALVMAAAL